MIKEFADRLDEGYKRKRLGHQMELPSIEVGKAANRVRLGAKSGVQFGHDAFEMSIRLSK